MVVNAKSRRGQALFQQACAAMSDLSFPVDARAVEDPKDLEPTVRELLAAKPDLLILGGGDGTISGLVDLMVGHDVMLGVLPLGTANSFARSLGIPLTIEGAVDVIRNGRPRRIDLGMIDHDYYANCAAMGISPKIAETVPHGLKRVGGRLGYLAWAAYQFLRFRPFTLIVEQNGTRERLRVVEVRISNGPYHGGTELVDAAAVDSGEIVVQAVCGHVKRRLIVNWAASILRSDYRKE
ncbi:MAG TPA: diacylglycerol kinase, partial [Candidatus Sphingomonas excrementigallinarum]|nr:diacylglycerol kinase [Candidatus Sphingomonas excrementigallinarum]